MWTTILCSLLVAGGPVGKLPPGTGKEMTEAIIAINKALGLENWEVAGAKPCVDRGGLEATIKDVSAEDTRDCASTAVARGFPGLGKDYAIGIPMAGIGPVTVFAVGIGEAQGWGAYSCDPKRRCNPTRLDAGSKQAKRLAERLRKACADPRTVWFPGRESACTGAPDAPPPAPAGPTGKAAAAPAKPAPDGTPPRAPWPVKE
jgi:hypothetical protein